MAINFTPGQFYGVAQFGTKGGCFGVRALAASGCEDDVQVHTHDDAHFILVVAGVYISSAYGAAAFARAPILIFNPPSTTHRDRFAKGIGTFVTVSLSADAFREAQDLRPLASEAKQLDCPAALKAAFRIARELRQGNDIVVLESIAWELAVSAADPQRLAGAPPQWAVRAYEAIMDRAAETPLGVGDIAAEIGVHPVHVARVFRHTWGCSPGELLRWRRVERAADLLRRTGLSAAHIAAGVGFVDQSHMTRAFRATYGVTPGAYRRAHVSRIQDSRSPI